MDAFKRIHLIVLDSLGVGGAPDADAFGDAGANTLAHIADACGGLALPALHALGLGNILPLRGVPPAPEPAGFFGAMREASNAKDTLTGHWELAGLAAQTPFRTWPDGFPPELLAAITEKTGRNILGNRAASGTEIIRELGPGHMASGAIILYTSADSVLQIAAHEDVVPVGELYAVCRACRELTLGEPYSIGRVIARPFAGEPGAFRRTANRHDFAARPPAPTVLDTLKAAGLAVVALGKITDIFDGQGITRSVKTASNSDGMAKLTALLAEEFTGLAFLNLVDFDAEYGHRRDARGYGAALERFDGELSALLPRLGADDLLLLTADHGNDPLHGGTDHTRERVPLLAYSPRFSGGTDLGVRRTFADVGATVADNFSLPAPACGESFLEMLQKRTFPCSKR